MADDYAKLNDPDFRAMLQREGRVVARYDHLELYEYDGKTWACVMSAKRPNAWSVMGPFAPRPGPDAP